MRVQNIEPLKSEQPNRPEASTPASASTEMLFSRKVTSFSQQRHSEMMQGEIDKITKQGEVVSKKADLVEFRKYKEMVRSLLHDTVSNSFEFSKSMRFDARGRTKSFALIKKVNTKLEDMTQELLRDEVDNIALMDSVDDIRGLLVDILM